MSSMMSSRFVSDSLQIRPNEIKEKFDLSIFSALPAILRESDVAFSRKEQILDLHAHCAALPIEVRKSCLGPFLIHNLRRLIDSFYRFGNFLPIEQTSEFYYMSLIDSFAQSLPSSIEIELEDATSDVVFPEIQARLLPCEPQKKITISDFTSRKAISSASDSFLHISSQIKVILISSPALYDMDYIDNVKQTLKDSTSFISDLREALSLIDQVNPKLYEDIASNLRYIAAIKYDDTATHRSFTAGYLKNVIFLSENSDSLGFAQAIIHEYSHNQLHKIMDILPLVNEDGNSRFFYSPWRDDSRPLIGLFHGAYVFSEVYAFLSNYEDMVSDLDRKNHVKSLRINTLGKILIALSQIDAGLLTETGQDIFCLLQNNAERERSDQQISKNSLSENIFSHYELWSRNHPDINSIRPETIF